MATDKKISQLAATATLALTDLFVVVASGFTRKITIENMLAIMSGSGISWIAPTLLNSWVNVGGTAQVAQYRKVGNRVYLRGVVQNGTSSPIFILPAGYRPAYDIGFTVEVHDNTNAPDYGHLRIIQDGSVMLEHPGTLNNHKVWFNNSFALD